MAEILVHDVDSTIVERLTERARRNGRSLEEETKEILVRAALTDMAAARDSAAQIRSRLSEQQHSDSVGLLAEDRAR